jgi:AraC family transcriptional regulator of adaptative response/methylated-DNA-[protein]-cysteine methyltransferase
MESSACSGHVGVMKNLNIESGLVTPTFASDDGCWRAVMERDTGADGRFVYAVRSTGVYCRASCPSRRPRREGVMFFGSPDDAERAGYRACLRCRPREASLHGNLVLRICRYLEAHNDEPIPLARLGEEAGLSPSHLQRVFKRVLGISPREYADACRFKSFKGRLLDSRSVTDALFAAGYGSTSRLYEGIASRLGMTPRDYRAGGSGENIQYAVSDSPVGRVLVASTARGVCAISLGGDDATLISALRREFPRARIQPAAQALEVPLQIVSDYLAGKSRCLDLPLDIKATAFQRQVWRALQSIPYGETRSYAAVAHGIGRPSAIRAVGRACASNRIALAIPCHRVIRSDGKPGGYRWGLKRKDFLATLEREKPARRLRTARKRLGVNA